MKSYQVCSDIVMKTFLQEISLNMVCTSDSENSFTCNECNKDFSDMISFDSHDCFQFGKSHFLSMYVIKNTDKKMYLA